MYKSKIFILSSFLLLLSINYSYSQWQSVSNGISAYSYTVLYSYNSNIYAGNYNGLFISTDNGIKWKSTSLVNSSVRVILAENNYVFAGDKGLMRSTDYGISFTQSINQWISITDIKKYNGYLFASAGFDGLYISSDNGINWQNVNINNSICLKLALKDNIIFAGCAEVLYSNTGGVYKSSDNGINWNPTSFINHNIKFFESNSDFLFAGDQDSILRSDNSGNNWSKIILPVSIRTITNIQTNQEKLFVSGFDTFYFEVRSFVSSDNGDSWSEFNINGNLVSIVNNSENQIASIEYEGVFVSHNNGVSWNYYLHKDVSVTTLYERDSRIFAGTTNYGMYYSDDNGLNWKGIEPYSGSILEFTSNDSFVIAGVYTGGIYRSSDNGISWVNPSLGNRTINAVYFYNSKLFADDAYVGIKYSTNTGDTWIGNAIPGSVTYCFSERDGKLFAGLFSSGIYYSVDSGNSWIMSGLTNASVNQFGNNSDFMFAASLSQPGIFRSSDNGINWEHTTLNKVSWSLLVSENAVIAGTALEGVHVSSDNGLTWISRNNNLASNNVFALLEHNGYVFSGLSGNGIYRIPVSELTNVSSVNQYMAGKYFLSQNYPNPFNPSTIISFSIPERSFVELNVYDVTGKLVKNIISEFHQAGNYNYNFESGNLPSGIYFYSLRTDEFIQSKKMTLIK